MNGPGSRHVGPCIAGTHPGGVCRSQSSGAPSRALDAASPTWIVVIREEDWADQPFHYAFRPADFKAKSAGFAPGERLRVALDLHEGGSSGGPDRGRRRESRRPEATARRSRSERSSLGADGAPAAVQEIAKRSTRGVRSIPPSDTAASGEETTVDMRLAAHAPVTIAVGADDVIDVLIASAADALDLPGAIAAKGSATEPVSVVLSIFGDAVVPVGARVVKVAPPRSGTPSQTAFEIRGRHEGTVQAAVLFRQGGTELGSIRHQIRVTALASSSERAVGEIAGAPRVSSDDGVLLLQVEPRFAGKEIRYQYRLHCPRLGFDFTTFESPRLLAPDGTPAESELAFVRRIYAGMTNQLLRSPDQVKRFAMEVEAFAEDLGTQLFPQDMIRALWDARDKIDAVRVMSWEPYIPWELVKLALPLERKSDDRYLGQYGMVRWLAGRSAARTLPLGKWSYYAATYPNNPANDVTREVDYFSTRLPQRGIAPVHVPSTYDAFVEALQNPTFDVLHVACHGDVKEDSIDKAELVITDELIAGRSKFVSISANVVGKVARFGARRPLVFLNACEAGRLGESLTTWGGWPSRLINAGAGAVVGASWPVHDVPSNIFATSFYDALLDGKSLSGAASVAREAAATVGDATWLSFKIFGDPHASRAG